MFVCFLWDIRTLVLLFPSFVLSDTIDLCSCAIYLIMQMAYGYILRIFFFLKHATDGTKDPHLIDYTLIKFKVQARSGNRKALEYFRKDGHN